MPTTAHFLQPTAPVQLATGFQFTEGPTWHPAGHWYFVDTRVNRLHTITPTGELRTAREDTGRGNGTCLDPNGNVVICEQDRARVTRMLADGTIQVVTDNFEGKRYNRPNDVICDSRGNIYFTDPVVRVPFNVRELETAVYRVAPDGAVTLIGECEFPNGLAMTLDERTLLVNNTRTVPYIQAFDLDADGNVLRRRLFCDMSDDRGDGVPDGMKLDSKGRVYCTGAGSAIWVFSPSGVKLGEIEIPEQPSNFSFGGPDLRTVLVTARTSVYTFSINTPGALNHPYRG